MLKVTVPVSQVLVRVRVKDTEGNVRERLVPETEAERREVTRRASAKDGGIDARDEDEPNDEWRDV